MGPKELSGHAQSKEAPRERKLSGVGYETSRGPQAGEGEAASWKINQRPNTEIQGHPGPWSLIWSSYGLRRSGGEEKRRSRGEAREGTAKGMSR